MGFYLLSTHIMRLITKNYQISAYMGQKDQLPDMRKIYSLDPRMDPNSLNARNKGISTRRQTGNVSRYLKLQASVHTTFIDANESYSVRISVGVSFYHVNLLRIRYCS
jgi:hypothetical protein